MISGFLLRSLCEPACRCRGWPKRLSANTSLGGNTTFFGPTLCDRSLIHSRQRLHSPQILQTCQLSLLRMTVRTKHVFRVLVQARFVNWGKRISLSECKRRSTCCKLAKPATATLFEFSSVWQQETASRLGMEPCCLPQTGHCL
jgi:hypothetical protein